MLMILRSERGYCSRCHLVGNNFAVEVDDGRQRLLCVPCLQGIEPGRSIPEPFGRTSVPSPHNDAWPPLGYDFAAMTETAFIIGHQ
jgi:hypothetical protein